MANPPRWDSSEFWTAGVTPGARSASCKKSRRLSGRFGRNELDGSDDVEGVSQRGEPEAEIGVHPRVHGQTQIRAGGHERRRFRRDSVGGGWQFGQQIESGVVSPY